MVYSKELTRRRNIKTLGISSPLLVPSFSSRGFADVTQIWEYTKPILGDCALVSSYDLCDGGFDLTNAPPILFLDSGGYEISEYNDFSESTVPRIPRDWDPVKHLAVLRSLSTGSSRVITSFDEPGRTINEQYQKAAQLFDEFPRDASDFLVKPDWSGLIAFDELAANAKNICENIDILGFTEKELGASLQQRLTNLAMVRQSLNKNGIDIPIHIFGCFDPYSIWLYYLCGGDIFDGLTWLRYGFDEHELLYSQSWAIKNGYTGLEDNDLRGLIWIENVRAIKQLQGKLRLFSECRDLHSLHPQPEMIFEILQRSNVYI